MPELRNYLPEPELVIALCEKLNGATGLPYYARHPQGGELESEVWYIRCAVLDFVVHDQFKLLHRTKQNISLRNDYRCGLAVWTRGLSLSSVGISLFGSACIAKNFLDSAQPKDFAQVDELMSLFRQVEGDRDAPIWYDSYSLQKRGVRHSVFPWTNSRGSDTRYSKSFQDAFAKIHPDLFFRNWQVYGNEFDCRLPYRENRFLLRHVDIIAKAFIPLLGRMFPGQSRPGGRTGSISKSLKRDEIEKRCEYQLIQGLTLEDMVCTERIEGAHIIPHQLGGTFEANNGLWLCSRHHRFTEGKLSGSRSQGVRFMS